MVVRNSESAKRINDESIKTTPDRQTAMVKIAKPSRGSAIVKRFDNMMRPMIKTAIPEMPNIDNGCSTAIN